MAASFLVNVGNMLTMQTVHLPTFLRGIIQKTLRGPIAAGDKFITLNDEYLNKFDEIVVIGDVHGCYDELKELIDKIHAESPSKNPNRTLKIIVGDLVNKGPKSKKVLELCRDIYPDSIISVRGNHDERTLERYKDYKTKKTTLEPKHEWIKSLPSRYISYLDLLPYSIKIPSLNAIIVHAGVQPSLEDPERNTPTEIMMTMRNIEIRKDPKTNENIYHCVNSDKEGAAWALFWPGPEHVYFGHDAKRRLQNDHDFATGLDTGCVYGGSLSYIYIKGSRKGEINSVKAKKVYLPVKDEKSETQTK